MMHFPLYQSYCNAFATQTKQNGPKVIMMPLLL